MTRVVNFRDIRIKHGAISRGLEHRRTGQHPFGGADRVLPEWIQWGGGSSRNFPGSIFSGGGGSSINFPGSLFCGVAEFFPLPAATDPKFRFFFVNSSNRP